MKAFKIAPLALAIGALSFSTVSSAEYWGEDGDSATVNKEVNVALDWGIEGTTYIGGRINVDRMGMAIIDDTQSSTDNVVDNVGSTNSSSMGDSALRDASGNIGVNIAAGDNNVQGNSAALAASDAGFVFGKRKGRYRTPSHGSAADAEVFGKQSAFWNNTYNTGHKNKASMGASALRGASGNIGVNIAAGNNNVQKNALAGSVGFGALAVATVNVDQNNYGNYTNNAPFIKKEKITLGVKLQPKNLHFKLGDVDYKGTSKQTKAIYPEVWNNRHPNGTRLIGHIDFDKKDKFQFRDEGEVKFSELGKIQLKGAMTGNVTLYTNVIKERTVNTSSMGAYAMAAASGNIGVNVATGSNNLQNNSLAIAALRGPAVDGHNGGGNGGHGGHGGHGGGYNGGGMGGMLGGIIGNE